MIREAIARKVDFTVVTCLGAAEYAHHCADPELQGFLAAGRLRLFESVTDVELGPGRYYLIARLRA